MKRINQILILISIPCIIGIAGCTIQNNISYNNSSGTNPISNYNQSSNSQTIGNTTANHYEASGYCPYIVDGDTIDVDGVGRIRFVGVNTPERRQPGYQERKTL